MTISLNNETNAQSEWYTTDLSLISARCEEWNCRMHRLGEGSLVVSRNGTALTIKVTRFDRAIELKLLDNIKIRELINKFNNIENGERCEKINLEIRGHDENNSVKKILISMMRISKDAKHWKTRLYPIILTNRNDTDGIQI